MADLPSDGLQSTAPFTNVGIDTFGPWSVVTCKTRGGSAGSKRWAILFSCLTTRAVHIKLVPEMTSSAFINALRRFVAIRVKVSVLRSDRGSNFIEATDDLRIGTINVEDGPTREYLYNSGTVWIFNSPHASHMGGAWEHMIGIARKILDNMLSTVAPKNPTHDVLATFMAEVSAIMNNRPFVPVSVDVDSPFVLSPAMLLTRKTVDCDDNLGEFSIKDLYKAEWRRVQALTEMFWTWWRKDYLQTLQYRRKWTDGRQNLKKGDVVILRDKAVCRNQWPLGIIVDAVSNNSDGMVRKVQVRVMRDGKAVTYTRHVTKFVLILSE